MQIKKVTLSGDEAIGPAKNQSIGGAEELDTCKADVIGVVFRQGNNKRNIMSGVGFHDVTGGDGPIHPL